MAFGKNVNVASHFPDLRGCKGFDWIWRFWKSMYRCRGLYKNGKNTNANTFANDDVAPAYALAA